jgi:hypothetical protein
MHVEKFVTYEKVSLAHMVTKVDVQSNHLDSRPHRQRFGYLLF